MSRVEKRQLTPIADISTDLACHKLINANAGLDKELYILLHCGIPNCRKVKGGDFAKIQTEQEHDFNVLRLTPDGVERIEIANQTWNYHFVQPLADERLLLAGARSCRRSATDIDHNARIFDRSGQSIGSFTIGDGVEDVQTTRDAEIWVSYFDEGVFGDEPMGANGLNCFDPSGKLVFGYEPSGGLDHICDCYALNVPNDDDVWFYYYTEFRLVRLQRGQPLSWWSCPIEGSNVFAIEEDLLLMQNGYPKHDSYRILRLGKPPQMGTLRSVRFLNDSGDCISGALYTARGPYLYLLDGARVYRVRPSEFV